MQGGDIASELPKRMLVAWEDTLAKVPTSAAAPESMARTMHRWKRAVRYWQEVGQAPGRLWLLSNRYGVRIEVFTFLGPGFADALEERLENEGWPVNYVRAYDDPGVLGRELSYRPDILQVVDYDDRRALHYGSRLGSAAVVAANIESRVLSRVIREGDMRPLIDSHVQADWFTDEDTARVFGYVLQHYSKHGEVPSKVLVNASFPNWRVLDPVDSLDPLLEEFRRKRKARMTTAMVADAVELIEEGRDYDGAVLRVTQGVAEINAEIVTTTDADFVREWEDRLDYYESLKHNGGMLGLPVGFPSMDEATAGLQPEQLVCIVATPKVGKSTLALKMALHITEQGQVPLFISFEMSAQEQAARFDAFRAGLNHQKLTRGLLSAKEHKILERAGREAERRGLSFIVTEDISASTTVSGVDAAIERHNPDVVFIDGVYLMHDELGEDPGSPQALTNITRNLKRLAQRRKRPIVMSTQALPSKVRRRTGIQADSIGYSSSFFQDSDVLFGLQEHPDGDDARTLRIINARNAGKREVTLTWDWETSTFEERGPAYNVSSVYEDDEDD